ncbi:MAG: hypothetical protein H6669_11880 [Ardenticatenaceae bacterium]|nr:hypothetical protein [Ardenticatenaceae bacterium]
MNIGMLWLDDDKKRPLAEKVQRAADHYWEKYGRFPELCLVNNQMLADEQLVGKIKVQPVRTVLRDHFWLGMQSQTGKEH